MSDWLTYSPASGHGNGTITLTASSISDLDYRMKTLVARNSQYSLSATTIVEQRIPPTSITFDSLSVVWVTDIPDSGGTATKDNCSYKVYAKYSDGSQVDVTNSSEVTGSLYVPPTTATTRQDVGDLVLTATFDGVSATTSVDVYQEGTEGYPKPYTPTANTSTYFSFYISSPGDVVYEYFDSGGGQIPPNLEIEYSINNGEWISLSGTSSGTSFSVVSGDIIRFRGERNAYYTSLGANRFSKTTAEFVAFGNIMSLLSKTNFSNINVLYNQGEFSALFKDCSGITSAENLIMPVTTFDLPDFSSVDRYANNCYAGMFYNCINLIAAPKSLPATTLASYCYASMFKGCSKLCYPPEMPIVRRYDGQLLNCFANMFNGCSSLRYSPYLGEITENQMMGYYMFCGCTSLRRVTCDASSFSRSDAITYWLYDVSPTGTFVKNRYAEWPSGPSGIPTGWTVIDAT